jgi:hypothetical protein
MVVKRRSLPSRRPRWCRGYRPGCGVSRRCRVVAIDSGPAIRDALAWLDGRERTERGIEESVPGRTKRVTVARQPADVGRPTSWLTAPATSSLPTQQGKQHRRGVDIGELDPGVAQERAIGILSPPIRDVAQSNNADTARCSQSLASAGNLRSWAHICPRFVIARRPGRPVDRQRRSRAPAYRLAVAQRRRI